MDVFYPWVMLDIAAENMGREEVGSRIAKNREVELVVFSLPVGYGNELGSSRWYGMAIMLVAPRRETIYAKDIVSQRGWKK